MVIAIIAVLISIAIPVFNGSMKKAANATDAANDRNLYGVLATMVNMGEIEFPEKSADPNDLQGVRVLVCRDSNTTPNAYGKLNGTIVPTWENFFHNNQRIGSLTFKGRENRCVFVHEKFNGSR